MINYINYLGLKSMAIVLLMVLTCKIDLQCQNVKGHSLNEIWEREMFLFRAAESSKSLINTGETIKVIANCNNALDSLTHGTDSRYLGYLLTYKGLVYLRMGNYYLSEICLKLAQAYGYRFKEKDLIGPIGVNLGSLAIVSRDYDKAETIFKYLLENASNPYNESVVAASKLGQFELAILEKDTLFGKILLTKLIPQIKKKDTYLLERNIGRFQMVLDKPMMAILNHLV